MSLLERLILALDPVLEFPADRPTSHGAKARDEKALGIVIPFFNPLRSVRRVENFKEMWNRLCTQVGVFPVLVVEQLEPSQSSQISTLVPANSWLPVRGGEVLWQKERLIQIGARALIARGVRNIAWLDADVIFTDENWPDEAVSALERHSLIQLFSVSRRDEKTLRKGVAYQRSLSPWIRTVGLASGYGWACRAEILAQASLPDFAIMGGGDALLWLATAGNPWRLKERLKLGWISAIRQLPPQMRQVYFAWSRGFVPLLKQGVGYLPQGVTALAHGPVARREYGTRYRRIPNFDPARDLKTDESGLAILQGKNSEKFRQEIRNYFLRRQD